MRRGNFAVMGYKNPSPEPRVRYRVRSLRAYRRMCEEAILQMRAGKISARECNDRIRAYKMAAELLMAEQVIKIGGGSDVELDHELGPDGGADIHPKRNPKVVGTKRVVTKRAFGPRGPTEETTVSADVEMPVDEMDIPNAQPVPTDDQEEEDGV